MCTHTHKFQVYLVFRSGGKPSEDTMGLGVKSSGAKFICRSQARALANPSTATSSTAQLGANAGKFRTEMWFYILGNMEWYTHISLDVCVLHLNIYEKSRVLQRLWGKHVQTMYYVSVNYSSYHHVYIMNNTIIWGFITAFSVTI